MELTREESKSQRIRVEGIERVKKGCGEREVGCLQHPGGVIRRSIFVRFDAERRGRPGRLAPVDLADSRRKQTVPWVSIGQCVTGD